MVAGGPESRHEYVPFRFGPGKDLAGRKDFSEDVDYARKCREHLFEEFREGGLAGEHASQYPGATVFRSPEHLLELTPGFIHNAIDTRLEGQFGGVFRYAAAHFRGRNLYMDAIRENCRALEAQLAARAASALA